LPVSGAGLVSGLSGVMGSGAVAGIAPVLGTVLSSGDVMGAVAVDMLPAEEDGIVCCFV